MLQHCPCQELPDNDDRQGAEQCSNDVQHHTMQGSLSDAWLLRCRTKPSLAVECQQAAATLLLQQGWLHFRQAQQDANGSTGRSLSQPRKAALSCFREVCLQAFGMCTCVYSVVWSWFGGSMRTCMLTFLSNQLHRVLTGGLRHVGVSQEALSMCTSYLDLGLARQNLSRRILLLLLQEIAVCMCKPYKHKLRCF